MYTDADIALIELRAREIRCSVISMLARAGSGHTAGPLGLADIMAALYFNVLRHRPEDPEWEDRDRLVLSNGHTAPVRYAAMAHAGYFPLEELMTLRAFGSRLQGHPERTRFAGFETTSGPLGEGLGQAAGMALAARMDERDTRTYCIMSDGEQQCGATWEAALFAAAHTLGNLTAILDRNGIQIGGPTESVLPLEPLREKYEAWNWHVLEIDGNDVAMFLDAVEEARSVVGKPSLIIAHTIPGKGVPEIEGRYEWHGKVPSAEEAQRWVEAINAG